jgi:hypothetical protein
MLTESPNFFDWWSQKLYEAKRRPFHQGVRERLGVGDFEEGFGL